MWVAKKKREMEESKPEKGESAKKIVTQWEK